MLAADLTRLHGPTPNDFLLGELAVYVAPYTDITAERFIGRTEASKTFTPARGFPSGSVTQPDRIMPVPIAISKVVSCVTSISEIS